MNTLDVTKFGVQELDAKDMVEVEGGGIIKNFFKNLVAAMKCDCNESTERWEANWDVLKGPKY